MLVRYGAHRQRALARIGSAAATVVSVIEEVSAVARRVVYWPVAEGIPSLQACVGAMFGRHPRSTRRGE